MSRTTAKPVTGSSARPNSSAGYDPAISDTRTSGGSSDTGQNALTVAPTSSRPSATVTSVTPAVHEFSAPATSAAPGRRATDRSVK